MKSFVERKLEKFQRVAKDKHLSLSCDIYYDDLSARYGEQFVVKLKMVKRTMHFRRARLRAALRAADKWLMEQ